MSQPEEPDSLACHGSISTSTLFRVSTEKCFGSRPRQLFLAPGIVGQINHTSHSVIFNISLDEITFENTGKCDPLMRALHFQPLYYTSVSYYHGPQNIRRNEGCLCEHPMKQLCCSRISRQIMALLAAAIEEWDGHWVVLNLFLESQESK